MHVFLMLLQLVTAGLLACAWAKASDQSWVVTLALGANPGISAGTAIYVFRHDMGLGGGALTVIGLSTVANLLLTGLLLAGDRGGTVALWNDRREGLRLS